MRLCRTVAAPVQLHQKKYASPVSVDLRPLCTNTAHVWRPHGTVVAHCCLCDMHAFVSSVCKFMHESIVFRGFRLQTVLRDVRAMKLFLVKCKHGLFQARGPRDAVVFLVPGSRGGRGAAQTTCLGPCLCSQPKCFVVLGVPGNPPTTSKVMQCCMEAACYLPPIHHQVCCNTNESRWADWGRDRDVVDHPRVRAGEKWLQAGGWSRLLHLLRARAGLRVIACAGECPPSPLSARPNRLLCARTTAPQGLGCGVLFAGDGLGSVVWPP